MYDKNVLFNAKFRGWKYVPVLLEVRSFYLNGQLFSNVKGQLCERAKELIESVYSRYNKFSSWKLSSLSHNELSWKCSRKGLKPEENGNAALSLADMKVDAARELLRRKKYETLKRLPFPNESLFFCHFLMLINNKPSFLETLTLLCIISPYLIKNRSSFISFQISKICFFSIYFRKRFVK